MGQSSAPIPSGPREGAVQAFVSGLRGKVLRAKDEGYDAARAV